MMRMEDGWRSIETATLDTGRQLFYGNRRELRNILYAREIGMDIGFILEEVEMTPSSRRCVVSRKAFVAMVLWAGKLPSALEGDMDMQFHGSIFCGLEFHLRYAPRAREVQGNGEQASCIHG